MPFTARILSVNPAKRWSSAMAETIVFQSGNSQAVRLPKEFRFKSRIVEIFRRGDEVILRDRKRNLGETLGQVLAELPAMTPRDIRDFDAAMALAKERRPAQERDWEHLFGAADSKPTPKAPGRRKHIR
jgi:antitoxin VapB